MYFIPAILGKMGLAGSVAVVSMTPLTTLNWFESSVIAANLVIISYRVIDLLILPTSGRVAAVKTNILFYLIFLILLRYAGLEIPLGVIMVVISAITLVEYYVYYPLVEKWLTTRQT